MASTLVVSGCLNVAIASVSRTSNVVTERRQSLDNRLGMQQKLFSRSGPLSRAGRAAARPCVRVQATREEDPTAVEAQERAQNIANNVKQMWDKVEDKTSFVIYAAGVFVLLWFSSTITSAFSNIPGLPRLLEFIGLGYCGWFVYRYLLFTPNRQELIQKMEDFTSKVTGEAKGLTEKDR